MDPSFLDVPHDFSGEVRLFPLPQLVMFPSNVQPLHVFESRYREMLEDAVEGDRLIALATLEPGYEADYYSRPPIAEPVCVGHVAHHEKTSQGTYHIVMIGLWRARVEQEILPVRSFRRARVSVLDEKPADARAARTRQLGRDLVQGLVASNPAADKLAHEFAEGNVSLGSLTDIVAFHLPFDLQFKLQLLAETDVLRRATLLQAALSQEPPPPPPPQKPRPGFSQN